MINKDYPIYFDDNICVVCGEHDSINGYDKNGRSVCNIDGSSDIIEYYCYSCGAKYTVKWDTMNNTFRLVNKSIIHTFEENIK